MNDDDGRPKGAAAGTGESDPSFSTALIFFLVFVASAWSLSLMSLKWQVVLPSDWLYAWLFCMLIPYILITGAAFNRIGRPFSDKAFIWFSIGMLSFSVGPTLLPVLHVWNHGWSHQECYCGPEVWSANHPEAVGRVSRYLCGDDLQECVVGDSAKPKGYVVEIDPLPWYEPHFAVDESNCRSKTVRLADGDSYPALGNRKAIRLSDCSFRPRKP